jgi:hypothetical protein
MTALLYVLGSIVLLALANRYQFWRIPKPRHWPRLLMYHSIANDTPTGMNTPPSVFEWQIAWLSKQGYRFCTVSELLANTSKEKKIAITFDDGFAIIIIKPFRFSKNIKLKPRFILLLRLLILKN